MAQLTHFITLYQGGKEATFKLNKKEYDYAMLIKKHGCNYNFEWFAWADYELSTSKRHRFNEIFDYDKGNFLIVDDGLI